MENKKFVVFASKVCGKKRYYPFNDLSKLFLSTIRCGRAKCFTQKQMDAMKELAKIVDLPYEEINERSVE